MLFSDIQQLVQADRDSVNELLLAQLDSHVPLINDVGRYIIGNGGKRLRPLVSLLCANACGERDVSLSHQLAVIVELFHTATLLHDDVVDASELRRGHVTANVRWGNDVSVLAGDFLYARAFQLMVDIGVPRIMQILSQGTQAIIEAEMLQLSRVGDVSIDEASFFNIIYGKTAKLFEASAQLGAISAEADSRCEAAFVEYGKCLGLAFQLVDDVLDYTGDVESLGKNVGDDLAEGKLTLPLIFALEHGEKAQVDVVKQAIVNESGLDVLDDIQVIIEQSGALDYTRGKAREFVVQAVGALSCLGDSVFKEALVSICESSLLRVK